MPSVLLVLIAFLACAIGDLAVAALAWFEPQRGLTRLSGLQHLPSGNHALQSAASVRRPPNGLTRPQGRAISG
jgi:hypothetical protein